MPVLLSVADFVHSFYYAAGEGSVVCGALTLFVLTGVGGWSSKQTRSKERPLHFFSGLKCAGTQVAAGGDRRAHG